MEGGLRRSCDMHACRHTGSGVIYEESGYILTNAHVVAGLEGQSSSSLLVTLQDGRMFPGRVLAADR